MEQPVTRRTEAQPGRLGQKESGPHRCLRDRQRRRQKGKNTLQKLMHHRALMRVTDQFEETSLTGAEAPGMEVNEMDLRLAVVVLPSMHPTFTLYLPGLGKFSQPIGNA